MRLRGHWMLPSELWMDRGEEDRPIVIPVPPATVGHRLLDQEDLWSNQVDPKPFFPLRPVEGINKGTPVLFLRRKLLPG